jgi:hypothetical protein
MTDNLTENNEHQPLTSGIKHWGLSGYASVLPRIKFGVTGQDSSPQSPTFHTADRWALFSLLHRPEIG